MGSKKSGPEEGRPIPSIKTRNMRREGYIVEEVADYSNMSSSFDQVLRGSNRKRAARDVICLRIGRKSLRNCPVG